MSVVHQHERFRPSALALAAGLCLQLAACGGNGDDAPAAQALSCADLNGRTVAASAIGLATTGAVVTSTQTVAAAGSGTTAVGEYCRVLGEINPVAPARRRSSSRSTCPPPGTTRP